MLNGRDPLSYFDMVSKKFVTYKPPVASNEDCATFSHRGDA